MKNVVYNVHAYRGGFRESHSYSVGIYSTKTKALNAAQKEEECRGGKYKCEILEQKIDDSIDTISIKFKVVKGLENVEKPAQELG